MRTSKFAEVVSEPGMVRAGQWSELKILSELRAEIGSKVSEPELFFVIKTG